MKEFCDPDVASDIRPKKLPVLLVSYPENIRVGMSERFFSIILTF